MPSTLERRPSPGDNDPRRIQFGAILEKIRRGGSIALTEQEKLIVAEIFRAASIFKDRRAIKLRDEISVAHLEFCLRLPPSRTTHDA